MERFGNGIGDYFTIKLDMALTWSSEELCPFRYSNGTPGPVCGYNLDHILKKVGVGWNLSGNKPNLSSSDRILQFCQHNITCGDGQSAGNHFDGANNSDFTLNIFKHNFGGTLSGNETVTWLRRHPQANKEFSRAFVVLAIDDTPQQDIGGWAETRHSIEVFTREIGFKDTTPTVEPKMGYWDQLYLEWEDTERYQPNNYGYVTANSSGTPQNRFGPTEGFGWTYRVLYSDNHNLDHTSPRCSGKITENCWQNEAYWGTSQINTDNRRYQANIGPYTTNTDGTKRPNHTFMNLLSDLYLPETELSLRMWMRQTRFGQEKNSISQPTRFFLPAEMQLIQQQQTIKAGWENSYPDEIDHYQYRIGHVEGGRQTDFSDWITICANQLGEQMQGQDTLTTAIISSTSPHSNRQTCGGDPSRTLQADRGYRIQIRAVDESRTENPNVRNYVHPDTLSLQPPPQAPTNLQTETTHNSITVTWDTIQTVSPIIQTQYRVDYIDENGYLVYTEWTDLDNPTDKAVTITELNPETELAPETAYNVDVRAFSRNGQGPFASSGRITTQATPAPTTPPTTPSAGAGGGGGGVFPIPTGNPPAPVGNPSAPGGDQEPSGTGFTDTSGSVHETNIVQLADMGVTRGCNPPTNDRFCPDRAVTRGEMATFLVRAFELPQTNEDPFTDTAGNVHRPNINRIAAAGISRGCNPPTNTRFCPDRAVTRAEMATFMTRVLELDEEGTDFDDTNGNIHATNISRFANAGITRGCNPPTNSRFCPDRAVTRAEMATFLVRSVTLNTG